MKPIMLVDRPTEISITENNPQAKDIIAKDFDIESNLAKLEGYYIKSTSGNTKGKLVPLAEYATLQNDTMIKPLVPSELYENVYFEAESFGQQYWEEYEAIVKQFILKLGNGSSWKVCYSKEEFESYKKEQKTRAEIDGRYKVVGGEVKVDSSNKQSQESAKSHSKEVNMASFQPKCSVEEVRRWLEENKINVEALPNQLQIIIKEFLERGCLQYRYEEKESISTSISKTQESMLNIQAQLNTLPLSLQTSLKHSIQEASTQSTKTEVYLCIECKHDGIEK
ncbi:hypothetical protein [Helicobacter zhangjianzhongii]|uniref:Uncharacterized protein n=1 Tax=Helicobacter zhangjianzhongii TaxID=2974574 RepID=A0ACC6FSX9_9HELI|nr:MULTISPECIES: hypothetical protein [unclassified Helicobacter]MDL0080464.1 hypothetical protein [Helicobacter sp. CPD2-1]MDL0082384.1 hypothetical protein [Helicobacter sp. XJK30-2]